MLQVLPVANTYISHIGQTISVEMASTAKIFFSSLIFINLAMINMIGKQCNNELILHCN